MFKETPIEEQILVAMNYIDQSFLCFGFQDDDDCGFNFFTSRDWYSAGIVPS